MPCCLLEHYLQAAQRVVDGRWRQSLSAKLEYPVFDVPGGDLRKPFVLEVWEHVVREVPPHNDEVRLDQLCPRAILPFLISFCAQARAAVLLVIPVLPQGNSSSSSPRNRA
jgi:sigma54-dependent transcription regulator